jgi:hypothetical protein
MMWGDRDAALVAASVSRPPTTVIVFPSRAQITRWSVRVAPSRSLGSRVPIVRLGVTRSRQKYQSSATQSDKSFDRREKILDSLRNSQAPERKRSERIMRRVGGSPVNLVRRIWSFSRNERFLSVLVVVFLGLAFLCHLLARLDFAAVQDPTPRSGQVLNEKDILMSPREQSSHMSDVRS